MYVNPDAINPTVREQNMNFNAESKESFTKLFEHLRSRFYIMYLTY